MSKILTVTKLAGGTIVVGGSGGGGGSQDSEYTIVKWSQDSMNEHAGQTTTHNFIGQFDYDSLSDYGYAYEIEEIEFGSGVTSIHDGAFQMCEYLTTVKIPSSVTYVGTDAFDSCNNLTNITVNCSPNCIQSRAFSTYSMYVDLTINSPISLVENEYDIWGLPSGSTIVCTDGTITIE